jgi:endoglycosylceramidase
MRRATAVRLAAVVTALILLVPLVAAAAARHDRRPNNHSKRAKRHRKQLRRLRKAAAPKGPLSHAGRWITDAKGRVVILHGLNMVTKRPPYDPAVTGFGADDAQFLRTNGFNTVRLGMIYKAVEPNPGQYDSRYISSLAGTEHTLGKQGIFSLIDFHQDLYNERFGGEGWPDWAVLDNGAPAQPLTGFPGSYLTSPGLNQAFDSFWANAAGPGGIGLQDRYGAAWRQVAAAFAGSRTVLGYDLLNEPWPGSAYASCASTVGCPVFDQNQLTSFSKRAIGFIRQADGSHLAFYEPLVTFDFGAATSHGDTGDDKAGFSFHDYCLPGAFGGSSGDSCATFEGLPFQNAEAQSQKTGDALLLSEFGSTDDLSTLERIISAADTHMVSWQEWAYCGCDDPTSQAPTQQALVLDPAQPPTGDNVRQAKLAVLSRPYPQVVAGKPLHYSFDPASGRFELAYDTTRATGSGNFRRGLTDIYIPKLHYPGGYIAQVQGARVISKPGKQQLILRAGRKATQVHVVVTPR